MRDELQHLRAAIQWIYRAQDATGCGGVSGGYYPPRGGWLPPYPETTGYTIPTLLNYAAWSGEAEPIARAVQMGDWEIEIQLDSGAVRGGVGINDHPVVFNTGQVMLGWVTLFHETRSNEYRDAAVRAAEWLVSMQDGDGKWSRWAHMGVPHAYHTRVAWPLLEVYRITDDPRFRTAAEKFVAWLVEAAHENGWIPFMGFTEHEEPLTHTVAYTLRGLFECSRYIEGPLGVRSLGVLAKAVTATMLRYELRKVAPDLPPKPLPATFDRRWRSTAPYSCVTGNAQIAIVWLKWYEHTGDARFLNAALKILDQIKATQSLTSGNPGILGAIPGSHPTWGPYNPLSFPNWATKFFADAILRQEEIMRKLEG